MTHFFYTPAMRYEEKKQIQEVDPYDVTFTDYMRRVTPEFFNTKELEKNFKGFVSGECRYDHNSDYVVYFPSDILGFTKPDFNGNTKMVKYYENADKKERGIKSESKIGKYIRKIAPFYNDKQVEALVNIVVEDSIIPDYKYNIGSSRADFFNAYTDRAERGKYLDEFKCLNASCMRYSFGSNHPSEVYASGDFEIHWLTNDYGQVAARVIICLKDKTYGPIYASHDISGRKLRDLINEYYPGIEEAEEQSSPWEGAKLLKIVNDGQILAPYIDICQSVKDDGDSLTITHHYGHDYDFCSTDGYVYEVLKCHKCGKRSSDTHEAEDGFDYCNSCVSWCDYKACYVTESTVEVYYSKWWYSNHTWSQSVADEHAVYDEENDKYYTKEYYKEVLENRKEGKEEEVTVKGKFKVGDKVKVIGNTMVTHYLDIGSICEVRNVGIDYCVVRYRDMTQHIDNADLELTTETVE